MCFPAGAINLSQMNTDERWTKRALLPDDLNRLEPLLTKGGGFHMNDDEARVLVVDGARE